MSSNNTTSPSASLNSLPDWLNPVNIKHINWNSLGVRIVLLTIIPVILFASINIITVNKNNNTYQTALAERAETDLKNDEITFDELKIKDELLVMSGALNDITQKLQSMLLNKNSSSNPDIIKSREFFKTQVNVFTNYIHDLESALIKADWEEVSFFPHPIFSVTIIDILRRLIKVHAIVNFAGNADDLRDMGITVRSVCQATCRLKLDFKRPVL